MSTEAWNSGIAGIISRDTAHDTPTQQPLTVGPFRNPILNPPGITLPVDPHISSSYGGPIPDHSQHWADYFSGGWNHLPTGKPIQRKPDSKAVMIAMQEPQNIVSAGSHDGWRTLFGLTTGAMRNGSSNSSSTY